MRRSRWEWRPRVALAVTLALGWVSCDSGQQGPTAEPSAPAKQAIADDSEQPRDGLASPRSPNLLVILWDTVRADRMSLYGASASTTPFLEEFARNATVYERAVSPGIWTVPSHGSLFTGLPASGHGASAAHKWLDHHFETLPEQLRDVGYATYAFSANPFVSTNTNLAQGFETVEHPWDSDWIHAVQQGILAKLEPQDEGTQLTLEVASDLEALNRHGLVKEAGEVTKKALLRWLRKSRGDRPFFAFLNYMEAHGPRIPSRTRREEFLTEEQVEKSWTIDRRSRVFLRHMFGIESMAREEVDIVRGIYDACLRDLDAITEDLITTLDSLGFLENTVIILTSDHGENLGEHGLFDHKYSVYNQLLRVPLVVAGVADLSAGRVRDLVSVLDVPATLRDLAGVASFGPGQSLRRQRDHGEGPVFAELLASTPNALERMSRKNPELDWTPWLRTFQAVEQNGYKFIRASDGSHELYDLRTDAGEETNLFADQPELGSQMSRSIDRWMQTFPNYDPSQASDNDKSRNLTPEMRAKLEALGYFRDD